MENYKNLGAGGTLNIVLSIIVAIVFVVGMWKMFVKAGEGGWASIIPIYNIYVLFQIWFYIWLSSIEIFPPPKIKTPTPTTAINAMET